MKKGVIFEKSKQNLRKEAFSGQTHRIKNNMLFGFREKRGVKFELKIREKGQFSKTSDVDAYT